MRVGPNDDVKHNLTRKLCSALRRCDQWRYGVVVCSSKQNITHKKTKKKGEEETAKCVQCGGTGSRERRRGWCDRTTIIEQKW